MAEMLSRTGSDTNAVLTDKPQKRPPDESELAELSLPQIKSWRAPTTILTALLTGLVLALAHHFMASYLDNKPIVDISISQAWTSRFGTALGSAVKAALVASVGAAYTQHQWLRLHQCRASSPSP